MVETDIRQDVENNHYYLVFTYVHIESDIYKCGGQKEKKERKENTTCVQCRVFVCDRLL